MLKLVKYLKDYKKECVIGPLGKFLEVCFELLVPLVVAQVVDVGIAGKNIPYIIKMCVVMVAFGVIGILCTIVAQYFAAKAAMGFGSVLRKDMFRHIGSLSYSELDQLGTATLVTRITSDINQAQTGVNLVLRLFLRSPFIVIGAVFMAFRVNAELAWIFVILVPVLAVIIFGVILLTIPLYKKVQNRLDGVLRLTRENLTGVRVIRAFSRQADEQAEFGTESDGLMRLQLTVGKISALLNPATYVAINLAVIAVLYKGGMAVDAGRLTQGELMALINYMSQILLALLALANLIVSYTRASASAGRIQEVFAHTSDMREGDQTQGLGMDDGKVVFRHVSFAYQDNQNVLNDINFTAAAGTTIGIIGGTGSGKSSVVNLIPRFYDVSGGAVSVDGVDVKDYTFAGLREKLGVVPQSAVLFAGTIRDNMRWGKRDATDEEIWQALEMAQAKEFIMKQPEGLAAPVAQGGKNFSGGQRQRLTIARALVGQPEILILDDSASALDFATDAALRRAIAAGTKEMTVFIVSQRVTSIKHADQILVLDDGVQVGFGTHETLLDTCEVYKEICMLQLSKKELER